MEIVLQKCKNVRKFIIEFQEEKIQFLSNFSKILLCLTNKFCRIAALKDKKSKKNQVN